MARRNFQNLTTRSHPKVLAVHLELMQYPILGKKIREKMRDMLFSRGIISVQAFEAEVRDKAIKSQLRERIADPFLEESEDIWQERLSKVRDIVIEFYFALNFKSTDLQKILQEVLQHKKSDNSIFLSFNPEIAPWKMLFSQAKHIENLPEEKKKQVRHHLREIIVVLTKGMLSDQLSFVGIAKNTLSIFDLEWIYQRRIGRGKIGGKAGGMMLAKSILHTPDADDPVDFRDVVSIPDSYFLGSDVIYEFVRENDLTDMVQQKYKPFQQITEEYPNLMQQFVSAKFPDTYRNELRKILQEVGNSPLIVRSSSHLEDNFGIAFAGKYESYFCPNQGASLDENLEAFVYAIKRVYASIISPDALAYRQQKGLIDYDERMAVLIQKVEGQTFGNHFFPPIAGVGFSYNPFQWNPRIDRSAGFLRIVCGMGTRAVDRLSSDYAKMVALSHPTLAPVKSIEERVRYSQKSIDLIDMEKNVMATKPLQEILDWQFPYLQLVGSLEHDGDLESILISGPMTVKGNIVLTFDGLLKNRRFITIMRGILSKLERHYKRPVDIEFTVSIVPGPPLDFKICLLQCRQQSRRTEETECAIPVVPDEAIILQSQRMVSTGRIRDIRYLIYVDPELYDQIPSNVIRVQLARVIGQLNSVMEGKTFILVGPGRWGSSNLNLGVPVSYADIFNCRALVEIAVAYGDVAPEASYGTHFFQDLVESNIYPLPMYPSEKGTIVRYDFFRNAPNRLTQFLPDTNGIAEYLKVIDVLDFTNGKVLEAIMNSREEKAIVFLSEPSGDFEPSSPSELADSPQTCI